MGWKITARTEGSTFADMAAEARQALAKATSAAVAAATEGAKVDMRKALTGYSPRMARVSNAIRTKVYPELPKVSIGAAGLVYANGDNADRIFTAFTTGMTITVRNKKALAVPLHNYRGMNGALLGPTSSFFAGRLVFLPARERSGLKIGVLAMKASGRPSAQRRARNTQARAGISAQIGDQWVPQFVLVRSVREPKLLSPEEITDSWAGKIPDLIEQAYELIGD